jgi:hypothetical protein
MLRAMSERAMIELELTFRPESEGGRLISDRILSGFTYRPHIVIGPPDQRRAVIADGNRLTETYLGIAFHSGPLRVELGQPFTAQAILAYWPTPEYDSVVPGATFTLREGARIVGHGHITKRWTEIN